MLKNSKLLLFLLFYLNVNIYGQQELPSAKFISSGNAFALFFLDYYYVMQGDNAYPGSSQYANNQKGDNAFSFRRIYLGYQYTFSEKFSSKINMELTDLSALNNGSRAFFLKEANLVWKDIYPLADLIVGHSSTPAFSVKGSEFYWRYRSIEATFMDTRGIRSSSDTGLRLKGLFNKGGTLGYNFMVANGNGTRPENDKYKLTYLNIWTKLLEKRLYLEIFQDYNKASGNRSLATTKGLAVWVTRQYTLGVEMMHQLQSNFGQDGNNISLNGFSFFAHTDILSSQFRAFGRYDSYNPDVSFSSGHYSPETLLPFDEQFFTFGLDYIPHTNIHIMPNIYINSYKNKAPGQSTPETEVVARLTLNVNFR